MSGPDGRPDGCDGRRLRFPFVLRDDESVPGALIAALGPQWLDDARPVLSAAGFDGRRPGNLALASEQEVRRLAWVIRCDGDALAERVGGGVEGDRERRGPVKFQGIELPRGNFETKTRRIGPRSLAASPHHRLAWMDRLLPYCPSSLELLVDECPACRSPLRWTGVGALDRCGGCGESVAPSEDGPLMDGLAEDYRAFAGLRSPLARLRAPALARLPIRLQAVPVGSLARFALRLGAALRERQIDPHATGSRSDVPPRDLAETACYGFRLLTDWPRTLLDRLDEVVADERGDPCRFLARRAALKAMVRRTEPPETAALLRKAVPDLVRHAAHGFAGRGRHYISREAHRVLGVKGGELADLRNWGGLRFVPFPGLGRQLGQYDAEQIDGIAAVLRHSTTVENASWALDLPVYGAEQLTATGRLTHADHPAILALGRTRLVSDRSVADLRAAMAAAILPGPPPNGAVTLRSAARAFGGAAKPWAAVVDALLRGNLSAWSMEAVPRIGGLMVDPSAFAVWMKNVDVPALPGGGISPAEIVSQVDASEILNLNHRGMTKLTNELNLRFVRNRRGLGIERRVIENIAARIVFPPELQHSGIRPALVRKTMHELDVPALDGGWCRSTSERRGLLLRGFRPL